VPLAQVTERFAKKLCLRLTISSLNESLVSEVTNVLEKNQGECPVFISLLTENGKGPVLRARKLKVSPKPQLLEALRDLLGKDNVWFGT